MLKSKLVKFGLLPLAAIMLLLLLAYWLITSSFFLRKVVLPMVGDASGIEMSAQEINLSLLHSSVKLTGVRVGKEKSPLAVAESLQGSFELRKILSGNIALENVILERADVKISKTADGVWNLPGEVKDKSKLDDPPKKATEKNSSSSSIALNLKNIKINNSSLTLNIAGSGKEVSTLEISGLNVSLPELRNGQSGRLETKGRLKINSGNDIRVSNGDWNSAIDLELTDNLMVRKLTLMSNLTNLDGLVSGLPLANGSVEILVNAAGDDKSLEVKNIILRQVRDGKLCSSVQVSGGIAYEPFAVDASINIDPLSEDIFSIVYDFVGGVNPGRVLLKYFGRVKYAGSRLSSSGKLSLLRSGCAVVAGKKLEVPAFELVSEHDVKVNFAESRILLNKLNAEIVGNNRRLVNMELKKSSEFVWKNGNSKFKGLPPEVSFSFDKLDLKIFKTMFLPDAGFMLDGGILNGNIVCGTDISVSGISLNGNIDGQGIDVKIGRNVFNDINFTQSFNLNWLRFKELKLNSMIFKLKRGAVALGKLNIKGQFNINDNATTVSWSLTDVNDRTLKMLPFPDELQRELKSIFSKLDAVAIGMNGDAELDFKHKRFTIKKYEVEAVQQGKTVISARLKPVTVADFNEIVKHSEVNLKFNNLAVKQFNSLLSKSGMVFYAGSIASDIVLAWNGDEKKFVIKYQAALNNFDFSVAGKRYQEVTLAQNGSCVLVKTSTLSIGDTVAKVSVKGQKALSLRARGQLDFDKGAGEISGDIVDLNEHLLNLFAPGEYGETAIKAKIKYIPSDGFKSTRLQGNIDIGKLFPNAVGVNLSGRTAADFVFTPDFMQCAQLRGVLTKDTETAVSFNASCYIPYEAKNSQRDAVITVNSEKIDLKLLEAIFKKSEKSSAPLVEAAPEKKKSGEMEFDFGKRKFLANLDLKGIFYGNGLNATLKAKAVGHGKTLEIKPFTLTLNDSPVNAEGRFESRTGGIAYQTKVNAGQLQLQPLLSAFIAGMENSKITLNSLELDICGNGLNPPALWDNMQGTFKISLIQMVIPNSLNKTMVGRIVLIPFEVFGKMQAMIPGSGVSMKGMGDVVDFVTDFNQQTKMIVLDQGAIDLLAKDGKIYIQKADFTGDFVKQLSFSGYLALGTNKTLNVNSTLNVGNIILPVLLQGTPENPRTDIKATLAAFLKQNALNIINMTEKIFGSSGKDVESILDKTLKAVNPEKLESLLNPQPDSSKKENTKPDKQKIDVQKLLNDLF